MCLITQLTSYFHEFVYVGRTAGSNLVEGQLVNSQTPEMAIIYAHIYVHPSIASASENCLRVRSEILREQLGMHGCNQTRL